MNANATDDRNKLTASERRAIREHLGHGIGYRRVRITKDGEVHYYGSTDPCDRSHDYWHFAGTVADIAREIRSTS